MMLEKEQSMFIAHFDAQGNKQSCKDHSYNVAQLAAERMKDVNLYQTAYLAGVLHDCGKYTDEFIAYITDAHNGKKVKKGSVIHTFAGCSYMLNSFHNGSLSYEDVTSEIIAYAIGAHHGQFDLIDEDGNYGFEHRLFKQPEYDKTAMTHFLDDCITQEELSEIYVRAVKEIHSKIDGFLKMAYRDNKDKSVVNEEIQFYTGMLSRLVLSAVISADRTDTGNFMSGKSIKDCVDISWLTFASRIEDFLSTKECTTPIQIARRELSEICLSFAENPTDIYRLNLPTGAGKTLSGLRFAVEHAAKYGKNRIIYVAPLISILEQNSEVIKDAVGDANIVLEHHSNVIVEDDTEDDYQGIPKSLLCETWEAPIIVTTLVQFLNTLFGGKGSQIRRFSSITNSVIIFDEVQSVPWRIISMFNLALNFLSESCNSTILLCSATQPCFDDVKHSMLISEKQILNARQEKYYTEIFKRSSIIYDGEYRLDELPQYIDRLAMSSGSILIVCNKKTESEFLYTELNNADKKVFHLSGAMCMKHREETLDELNAALKSDDKVICVATQVIEAGVDISFNTVVRFMAGLDSIVQANGRCNRNGEHNDKCHTHIINCIDESLVKLNEIQKAKNAMNTLLYEYNNDVERFDSDMSSALAVKTYYDNLYSDIAKNEGYWDYPIDDGNTLFELLSMNKKWGRAGGKRSYFINQAFKTAGNEFKSLDSDSVSVLVPYGEGTNIITELCSERAKHDFLYAKELVTRAKKYTVSIMLFQKKKLVDSGALYRVYDDSVYVLRDEYYDHATGLTARKEMSECNILIL